MTRIRVFIKIPSDDAFELKAQALNNDPRLKAAGISALKFENDRQYIADGEFSPELPPPTAPEPVSSLQEPPVESSSDPARGGRLRVFLQLLSDDAYELKAQALNNDPRLKEAGISALKFEGDKKYIADGDFSSDLPPQTTPEPTHVERESDSAAGGRLRVFLQILNEDAYELKAQALNNDPRLKEAGISALKFVGDEQYIVDGEFSSDLPSQKAAPAPLESKSPNVEKVRVYLRVPRADTYQLISSYLNGDPRLREAGISDISLVKGGGVAAPSVQTSKQRLPKKRSPLRGVVTWGLILGVLLIAGAVFAAPALLAPPVAPTPTTAIVVPTGTATSPQVPITGAESPTPTTVIITKTKTVVPTKTETPTLEPVVSCVAPQEATILQQLNCRYGPGAVYIYRAGLSPGQTVQIMGRADTAKGTWIYVQIPFQTPPPKCWINADPQFSEYQGDVSCLESYYPEKAPLPPFSKFPDRFPPPSDARADRSGDQVSILWTVHPLAAGDRSDRGKPPLEPLYLIETWTCQGGKIVFTPQGYYLNDLTVTDPFLDGITVTDEAGCSEPSHGRIYLAHADGYVGPVEIHWP